MKCALFSMPATADDISRLADEWPQSKRRLDNPTYTIARYIHKRDGWAHVAVSFKDDQETIKRSIRTILDMREDIDAATATAAIAFLLSDAIRQ